MDGLKRQQAVDEIGRYIRCEITSGFVVLEDLVERSLRTLGDGPDAKAFRPQAKRQLRAAIAAQRAEEKRWPAVTDCDRLDTALVALEKAGLFTRLTFCYHPSGIAEIRPQLTQGWEGIRKVRGYAHCHICETDPLFFNGALYFDHGPIPPSRKAAIGVGHEIVSAIRAQGLEVRWGGNVRKRIAVALDWKRRLPRSVM
jgi:hypothetical protein